MTVSVEESKSPKDSALASRIGSVVQSALGDRQDGELEKLQGEIDAITVKTVSTSLEPYRESAEDLLRTLRSVFGQIARFVEGDFREAASFYLGQLYSLAELTDRVRHRRLPKNAVALVTRKDSSARILCVVVDRESIGASALAKEVGMQESNLSALCKELVACELLRADRFGKRVRYSATPLTHAVVAHLQEAIPSPNAAEVATGVAAATEPDLSKTMAAAAAASLDLGNVMANTNDFASGLFALGGLRGADAIVIDPSGKRIRIESKSSEKGDRVQLPKSIQESLSQQTRGLLMFEGAINSEPKPEIFSWGGQRVRIAAQQTPGGNRLRLEFVDNVNAPECKQKVQIAFKEIEQEKTRLVEFQRFYANQVLQASDGHFNTAARTLGIKAPELKSMLDLTGGRLLRNARPAKRTARVHRTHKVSDR